MSLTDLIYLSQKSLRSNILRSVLTSLGIIIGVSSVITMISIGSGARQEVEEQIERFGSNNLILRSQSSSNRGVSMGANSINTLTLKDMEALKNELPAISAIAPRVSLSTQIIANGNNWLATVTGTTNDYFNLGNWKFELGRSFQDDELDSGSRVAIIGKTVQKNLFGTDSPIDEVIRINKVPFTVIGLLDAKGGTAWADLDDTIVVPLKTAKQRLVAKKFPGDQIRSMTINVSSSDLLFKTEKDIEKSQNINLKLAKLHETLFIESSPGPVKFAASLIGLCNADTRLPLVDIQESTKVKIKECLQELELI